MVKITTAKCSALSLNGKKKNVENTLYPFSRVGITKHHRLGG